jgi:hypothetical protein
VIRWLKATGASEVSREDIRAGALTRTVDARGADAIIARLEEMGVLMRERSRRGNGRPPLRWRVAPALSGNPDEGEEAPPDGHPSHLRTPPTGNPGNSDLSPLQQPAPPGFSLHKVLSEGKPETRR